MAHQDLSWYERIIQAVGDVLTGRAYWRQRAQRHEQFLIREPLIWELTHERDEAQVENSFLRLAAGDTRLDVMWFKECSKVNAEAQLLSQERARLEQIVIDQQKRLKYYELRHDIMHREFVERVKTNARLNKELQEAQRALRRDMPI
jgi:hypothetical protein